MNAPIEIGMHDRSGYLERMALPQDKLWFVPRISPNVRHVLDVGCADGAVTIELARRMPGANVLGVDLNRNFIYRAEHAAQERGIKNVQFKHMYLRTLLAKRQKFQAVAFTSVLHEFFHYGEGMTSVLKALADANELLESLGDIFIRDMIVSDTTRRMPLPSEVERKIRAPAMAQRLRDFEAAHGQMNSVFAANHFLLKYFYIENWERECPEMYIPITEEQYFQMFQLLGMKVEFFNTYCLDFLREKWRTDFGFTDEELSIFFSTTLISAKKI